MDGVSCMDRVQFKIILIKRLLLIVKFRSI